MLCLLTCILTDISCECIHLFRESAYSAYFPLVLLICREIEDTILLALQKPDVYDDIARGTRRKFESNRPRAVLFEGPPGLPHVNNNVLLYQTRLTCKLTSFS